MSESGNAAAAAKRPQVTKRRYLTDGEEQKDVRKANGLSVEVLNGGALEISREEIPEDIFNGAAWFGLHTVLTNAFGGAKDEDAIAEGLDLPAYRFQLMESRWENFKAGEWSEARGETGPRVELLAQAVVAAYAKTGDHKDLEEVKAKLRADESLRKSTSTNPAIQAEYKKLQLEAARKAAERAEAAAGTVSVPLPAF